MVIHSDNQMEKLTFDLVLGLRGSVLLTSRVRMTREQTLSMTPPTGSSWWGERS